MSDYWIGKTPINLNMNDKELIALLQEKVRNLTNLLDQQLGTPCAEIRW